jgi:hypothetical protein
MLVSYEFQPATLHLRAQPGEPLRLKFLTHDWSGVAQIRSSGGETTADLYSPQRSDRTVIAGSSGVLSRLSSAAACVPDFFVILLVSIAVGLYCGRAPFTFRSRTPPEDYWLWLWFALPSLVVWTLWLQAFWPGLLSNDSIGQWEQILSGHFSDAHPVFHTAAIWAITRIWLSPAAVALVQMTVLGCSVGWALARIRAHGAPLIAVCVASGLLAVSPVTASMAITLWKDIPYSAALVILSVMVLEIVASDGNWLNSRRNLAMLGLVALALTLFRYNGAIAAWGTLAILSLAYARHWRQLGATCLGVIVIFAVWAGPVSALLGVRQERWVRVLPLIPQVAAHVSGGTPMDDAERTYLNSIRPLSDKWNYSCYSIDSTLYDGGFRRAVVAEDPERFFQTWWDLTTRNPRVNVQHVLCSSSLVWRIGLPERAWFTTTPVWKRDGQIRTIPDNRDGVVEESQMPQVRDRMGGFLLASESNAINWLIWGPALYLYVLAAVVLWIWYQTRQPRFLLLMIPVGLHSAGVVTVGVSQDFRYQFGVYLVCLVIAPLAWRYGRVSRGPSTLQ